MAMPWQSGHGNFILKYIRIASILSTDRFSPIHLLTAVHFQSFLLLEKGSYNVLEIRLGGTYASGDIYKHV